MIIVNINQDVIYWVTDQRCLKKGNLIKGDFISHLTFEVYITEVRKVSVYIAKVGRLIFSV